MKKEKIDNFLFYNKFA